MTQCGVILHGVDVWELWREIERDGLKWFISSLCTIRLLWFNQINQTDETTHINGVLMLADFFSILLKKVADQLHRFFRRGSGMNETGSEICEQAHTGLVNSQ